MALLHLAVDQLPGPVVRTRAYVGARRRLSANPDRFREPDGPALPFEPQSWRGRKLASSCTDLVVDAFPGSGSTFVSNCLRDAIDRPCNIESHFHYTAQLRRALAFDVPALVVVRRPADACASLAAKEPVLWHWTLVLRWLAFHRFVQRHRRGLEIFRFEDVVADIDMLRRRSRAVRRLVASPLAPNPSYRRASAAPRRLRRGGLVAFLLRRAERLYESLFAFGATVTPASVQEGTVARRAHRGPP